MKKAAIEAGRVGGVRDITESCDCSGTNSDIITHAKGTRAMCSISGDSGTYALIDEYLSKGVAVVVYTAFGEIQVRRDPLGALHVQGYTDPVIEIKARHMAIALPRGWEKVEDLQRLNAAVLFEGSDGLFHLIGHSWRIAWPVHIEDDRKGNGYGYSIVKAVILDFDADGEHLWAKVSYERETDHRSSDPVAEFQFNFRNEPPSSVKYTVTRKKSSAVHDMVITRVPANFKKCDRIWNGLVGYSLWIPKTVKDYALPWNDMRKHSRQLEETRKKNRLSEIAAMGITTRAIDALDLPGKELEWALFLNKWLVSGQDYNLPTSVENLLTEIKKAHNPLQRLREKAKSLAMFPGGNLLATTFDKKINVKDTDKKGKEPKPPPPPLNNDVTQLELLRAARTALQDAKTQIVSKEQAQGPSRNPEEAAVKKASAPNTAPQGKAAAGGAAAVKNASAPSTTPQGKAAAGAAAKAAGDRPQGIAILAKIPWPRANAIPMSRDPAGGIQNTCYIDAVLQIAGYFAQPGFSGNLSRLWGENRVSRSMEEMVEASPALNRAMVRIASFVQSSEPMGTGLIQEAVKEVCRSTRHAQGMGGDADQVWGALAGLYSPRLPFCSYEKQDVGLTGRDTRFYESNGIVMYNIADGSLTTQSTLTMNPGVHITAHSYRLPSDVDVVVVSIPRRLHRQGGTEYMFKDYDYPYMGHVTCSVSSLRAGGEGAHRPEKERFFDGTPTKKSFRLAGAVLWEGATSTWVGSGALDHYVAFLWLEDGHAYLYDDLYHSPGGGFEDLGVCQTVADANGALGRSRARTSGGKRPLRLQSDTVLAFYLWPEAALLPSSNGGERRAREPPGGRGSGGSGGGSSSSGRGGEASGGGVPLKPAPACNLCRGSCLAPELHGHRRRRGLT